MNELDTHTSILNVDDILDKLNLAKHIVHQRVSDDNRECIDRLIDAEGNIAEVINALHNSKEIEPIGDWESLEEWIEHHAPWIQGTDDRVVNARELVRIVRQCKQTPPKIKNAEQVRADECERVANAVDKELTIRVDKCNEKAKSLSSYPASWAGLKHEAIALSSMRDYIREHIRKQAV
jgi:hypothetical protein